MSRWWQTLRGWLTSRRQLRDLALDLERQLHDARGEIGQLQVRLAASERGRAEERAQAAAVAAVVERQVAVLQAVAAVVEELELRAGANGADGFMSSLVARLRAALFGQEAPR